MKKKKEKKNSDTIIKLKDVCLSYKTPTGSVDALENINIDINEKEFVCILGPSGCGKTSLLNLVAGFLEPTGGEILHNGEPIEGINWQRGVVFQDANLFEWLNVRDNISFGLKMRHFPREKVKSLTEEMLETVGLVKFAEKYIYELSGGMRQRVGIARTLINDPHILLMDEPFNALDAQTREQMQAFTRRIWVETGKTILFITHDVDEAMLLGTRIIVMSSSPGRVKKSVRLDYTHRFMEDPTAKFRYTQEYYDARQDLINSIKVGKEAGSAV